MARAGVSPPAGVSFVRGPFRGNGGVKRSPDSGHLARNMTSLFTLLPLLATTASAPEPPANLPELRGDLARAVEEAAGFEFEELAREWAALRRSWEHGPAVVLPSMAPAARFERGPALGSNTMFFRAPLFSF